MPPKLILPFCFFFLLSIYNTCFAQGPKLMLPIGHTDIVRSARFSPDGKKIVTTSNDKTAKIWEAATGSLLADLKGHGSDVISAQFSPDGKKIVTASWDSTAIVWDVASATIVWNLTGHSKVVYYAEFSPDGKKIITVSGDKTAKIWDVATGKLLHDLSGEHGHTRELTYAQFSPVCVDDSIGGKRIVTASKDGSAKIWDGATGNYINEVRHSSDVNSVQFSPDGKLIVTASADTTTKVWNVETGKFRFEFSGHKKSVVSAQFSPDGKSLVTASLDSTAMLWYIDRSIDSLSFIARLNGHLRELYSAEFSPDGKKIVTCSKGRNAKIWDAATGNFERNLIGHKNQVMSAHFSPDSKTIVTASYDNTAKTWDATTARRLTTLIGRTSLTHSTQFSPDGKFLVTSSDDRTAKIWDAITGQLITSLIRHSGPVYYAEFSPDGKKIVTASWDSTAVIWDGVTSEPLFELVGHKNKLYTARFSPACPQDPKGGKRIVTASADTSVKIWETATGKMIRQLRGQTLPVYSAQFSPDGQKIITSSADDTVRIYDAVTGNFEKNIGRHGHEVMSAQFNPDGKTIVTASQYKTATIWDANTGTWKADLTGHTDFIWSAEISPDGKTIATASNDRTAKIWDAVTGKWITDLIGHSEAVTSVHFSKDGKKLVTTSWDNTSKIWSLPSGKCLYTFFALNRIEKSEDKNDYLVIDSNSRYDGTEGARKTLYFTCGTEMVTLEQVKDSLWVPYLAERINNEDTINAPSLDELNICNRTPEIEIISSKEDEYKFTIRPRGGGLGETVVSINGTKTKPFKPEELDKKGDSYELTIKKEDVNLYLKSDAKSNDTNNIISVKAYPEKSTISSRGAEVSVSGGNKPNANPPNLYAIVVGVSEYKGKNMNLQFAAKDATDISATISNAAKKYFNVEGKNHVFMYNFTTREDRYQLPKKDSIRKAFEEIGNKAAANDILLLFFAGHGFVAGDSAKLFYFLTAEADTLGQSTGLPNTSISTKELIEWMNPSRMKAQRKILIFDACQSGQAITDMESNTQQVKAIDKLNEDAGLFILSASASNQSAYEMGRLQQGLLTYCLLEAIKQDPSVLQDNRYLNLSLWFAIAGKTVSDMASEMGARQEPKIYSNTNFNIGVVDEDVIAKISLPPGKPLFKSCNFQNSDRSISVNDDLDFGELLDNQLAKFSSKGESLLRYQWGTKSPDAFSLIGEYSVDLDNTITVTFSIKQYRAIKGNGFQVTGVKDKLEELAASIIAKALEIAK